MLGYHEKEDDEEKHGRRRTLGNGTESRDIKMKKHPELWPYNASERTIRISPPKPRRAEEKVRTYPKSTTEASTINNSNRLECLKGKMFPNKLDSNHAKRRTTPNKRSNPCVKLTIGKRAAVKVEKEEDEKTNKTLVKSNSC